MRRDGASKIARSIANAAIGLAGKPPDKMLAVAGLSFFAVSSAIMIPMALNNLADPVAFTGITVPIVVIGGLAAVCCVPIISGYREYLSRYLEEKEDTRPITGESEYRSKSKDVLYPIYFATLSALSITATNYLSCYFISKELLSGLSWKLGMSFGIGMATGTGIFLFGGFRGATRMEANEGVENHLNPASWEYTENAQRKARHPDRSDANIVPVLCAIGFAIFSGGTTMLALGVHDIILEAIQNEILTHSISVSLIFIPVTVLAALMLRGMESLGRQMVGN